MSQRMQPERKRGVTYSGAMHVLLLLLIIVGLPTLFMRKMESEPAAISVEILPIAALSNVRPSQMQPIEQPNEEKPEEKKQDEEKEPTPVAKRQEKPSPPVKTQEPEKPKPEPKPEEKPDLKPEQKKPEEKKPEEKKEKEKPKEDPLVAVLKSVKDTAAKTESNAPKQQPSDSAAKNKSYSTKFDQNSPEAMSIRDSISSQVYPCWSPPVGARDAHELQVLVEVEYSEQGEPIRVELARESAAQASRDPFFRAAADSAMRAVRNPKCSPLKGMPLESYHIWKSVEINFDPRNMLY